LDDRFPGWGALRKTGVRRVDEEAENQRESPAEVLGTSAESRAEPVEAAAFLALIERSGARLARGLEAFAVK